jgi:cob(I)alamin adenosyltransferase
MKIYTKTGDNGTTSLFSGGRVPKNHLRVEAYGTVDELNSMLGVVRAHEAHATTDGWLHIIQGHLFHLGADLATPLDSKADWVVRMDADKVNWLEGRIDEMTAQLPELRSFILPGGAITAAHLHVARTVCRRAERLVVTLQAHEPVGELVGVYLNRLSDFLFTLARWENMQHGVGDERWSVS